MGSVSYTLIPIAALIFGSLLTMVRRPGPGIMSGMQHLAAGVVFAAAAVEVLPQVMHQNSPWATLIGGAVGLALMLGLKAFEGRLGSGMAFLAAIAVDILVDGLVLGLGFIAGDKAGLLLTIALTLEVFFIGISTAFALAESSRSKLRPIIVTTALGLLLPVGTVLSTPVSAASPTVQAGFLAFGLIALLYLVTEELLTEAHESPDSPLISSMFFVGFLGLLLLEELAR